MNRKYFAVAATLAIGIATSACSTEAQPSAQSSSAAPQTTTVTAPAEVSTTTVAPETSSAQPSTSSCASVVGQWNTADDSTPIRVGFSEVLDVRAASHPCFDRIVIETGSLDPVGFQVGYVSQVSREGSGTPVTVEGSAVLRVVINTSGERFSQCDWRYNLPSLREVACTGSFEGQTTFAVGVSRQAPFAVYHLANNDKGTMRVVIDIAH